MHAELRIDINQEVNVIRHNLRPNQDAVRLLDNLQYKEEQNRPPAGAL